MIKNYAKFFTVVLLIFSNFLFGQEKGIWRKINSSTIASSELKKTVNLKKFESFELKLEALATSLKSAPNRDNFNGKSSFTMEFPDMNGKLESYYVQEASVMHPDLAKKYPKNKSYIGVSIKDGSKKIRFSLNEIGLNAIIIDANGGIQFIEPLSKDKKNYKVFGRSEMEAQGDFHCLTENMNFSYNKSQALKMTDDGTLRTYRLALAGTGEYSTYHINEQGAENGTDEEKKTVVLAAMTTAITRVNALFENDLAISLRLVANNDDLIYLDPDTDPYSNFEISMTPGQNQTNCDNVIKAENYDIGHVFTTNNISGVDQLGIVCKDGLKAKGSTGSTNPDSDNFYFDFVAHEFGHQFGANHTFNGDEGTCGDPKQRNPEKAVEPGSGSTIMAYAGYCFSQNVQLHSDLYFHITSIQEIREFVTNGAGSSCAEKTDLVLNKNAPIGSAGEDRTIPKGTPYKLTGTGSDADGDLITFTWEQIDNGITAIPPSPEAKTGALYRSVSPTTVAERYLPSLNTLRNGLISSTWEVTPEVGRQMNFMLTVRDNNTEAGRIFSDDLLVNVSDAAGPFMVTSQNFEDLVWMPNSQETITWDVAGTNVNGINVTKVNILLSTDGGRSFSTVLASDVPNDGSHPISVPNVNAPYCFIMVEAVGNIFFSVNKKRFSIGEFNEVCSFYASEDTPLPIPDNDPKGVTSTITIAENASVETVKVRLINEINPTVTSPGIIHTFLSDLVVTLESPQGTVVELFNRSCNSSEDIMATFADDGADLTCNASNPGISGIKKPAQELSLFSGESIQGEWILTVTDYQGEDEGILEGWGLEICSSQSVLGVEDYTFDDFKLFPNPSDGIFTLKFRTEETDDVEIFVYDVLGRKIASKTYKNSINSFDEQINFSPLSKGIYMLRIKRGNRMSTRKIFID